MEGEVPLPLDHQALHVRPPSRMSKEISACGVSGRQRREEGGLTIGSIMDCTGHKSRQTWHYLGQEGLVPWGITRSTPCASYVPNTWPQRSAIDVGRVNVRKRVGS